MKTQWLRTKFSGLLKAWLPSSKPMQWKPFSSHNRIREWQLPTQNRALPTRYLQRAPIACWGMSQGWVTRGEWGVPSLEWAIQQVHNCIEKSPLILGCSCSAIDYFSPACPKMKRGTFYVIVTHSSSFCSAVWSDAFQKIFVNWNAYKLQHAGKVSAIDFSAAQSPSPKRGAFLCDCHADCCSAAHGIQCKLALKLSACL